MDYTFILCFPKERTFHNTVKELGVQGSTQWPQEIQMRFGELSHLSYTSGSLRVFKGTMGIMSYYRVGGNFPIGRPDTKMSKETSGLLACVSSSLGVFYFYFFMSLCCSFYCCYCCHQIPGSSPNIKWRPGILLLFISRVW